ncbi:zinc-dependent metalloprotease family protein [Nocardioides caldifontis]|uniref:zinc-dependent metalloprotease family protein n=1 Tax=Nocardioides caldifontis TaxID=2588938 RepID=UPI0011DF0C6A|nr:zinc-dependent metalloprotease family protein [Nocardioides caldifontis]
MRRLLTLAAVLPTLLAPAVATVSATADPGPRTPAAGPATSVLSGVVTSFVTEGRAGVRTALVDGDAVVPVKGGGLEPGTRVTVRVADVPGRAHRVVEVLDVRRAASGSRTARASTVRHKVYVAFAAPVGTSVRDSMPSAKAVTTMVNGKVSSYWSSQTGGRITFRVAATTKRYASKYRCGNAWALWEEAARKFRGAATGANKHVLVVVPRTAERRGCAVGMGSVGSSVSAGGVSYVALHSSAIYAHELGHNMGLGHANSLLCGSRQDTTVSAGGSLGNSGCRVYDYDDYLEVMSSSGGTRGTGALNGPHVEDMGLLPSAIRTVPAGTTVKLRLAPLSGAARSLRVAKVVEPSGVAYFVQYRASRGIDARKAPYRLGVELHREDPTSYRSTGSLFLDATPSGRYDLERALLPGRTFTSASGRVTVQVLSQDSTGATVLIRNGV